MGTEKQTSNQDADDEPIVLELRSENKQVLDRAYLLAIQPQILYILKSHRRSMAQLELAQLWIEKDHSTCSLTKLFRADMLKRLLDGESISVQKSEACVAAVVSEAEHYDFSIDEDALTSAFMFALAKLGIDGLVTELPPESEPQQPEPLA
ncbi:MAG TPA: hypothetical protein VHA78_02065 [Candidatus Peribacteraceae bacterium]|nr:hypothetical protein [Candidatus Peribacteraceae bacterium]